MFSRIFLEDSAYVDYSHPLIRAKAAELFDGLSDAEKIETAYLFVRDKIPHTMDIRARVFPAKASDTLIAGSGICHAKANLLAALLRSAGIPTGFCFEKITLADDARHGYCIHGFNAVLFEGQWRLLDARGNNARVKTVFSLEKFSPAYPPREKFGEYYLPGIFARPEPQVMDLLNRAVSITDLLRRFPDTITITPEIL